MAIQLTWLGHGGWAIRTPSHHVLVDPFLTDSPVAPMRADQLEADFVLVSHGHFDHVADAAAIARRTGGAVVAIFEIAEWFRTQHQIEKTVAMNVGGGMDLPFGRVEMTPALHSSQLPDGSYGGVAVGFLLTVLGQKIYFACDTALFGDMQQIGARGIDLAVLPIGDVFTMGPSDSIAAIRLLRPRYVLPDHYNTWPPIQQDAQSWATRVRAETEAHPAVLNPGEPFTLPSI